MIDNKIKPIHTQRSAFVYIRHSTSSQAEHHCESTACHYALVQRACDQGWPNEQIIVVDDYPGVFGASVGNRICSHGPGSLGPSRDHPGTLRFATGSAK